MKIIISILLSVYCIPLFAGSIQVSAATEKQIAPDQATLSVQFKLIANSSSEAKQQVNQQVNQLFSKLEKNTDFTNKQFLKLSQTQGIEWRWQNGKREQAGYYASVGLHIVVTDLQWLDSTFAQIAHFKQAQINATAFSISNRFEHEQQMLQQALKKAKDKALLMAKAYQQQLGKAVTIVEQDQLNDYSRPPMMARMQVAESAPNMAGTVSPLTVRVAVKVEFDLQ